MTIKEKARQLIDELPENADWDEIQYRIYLRQVIDESETQLSAGQGLTQEQAQERLAKWLK